MPAPRPRVISASKRTDIPAFYLKWMIARCREGWVDVPNPMFRHAPDPLKRLTHVSLRPEHVLAIVWWSKNYAVYERFHEAFASYLRQYYHFTINSRRPDLAWLEPDVPPIEEVLRQVRFLVQEHGPEMLAWRYDPLVFWSEGEQRWSNADAEFFAGMCAELGRLGVTQVFTSVADHYRKFEQRMQRCWPARQLRDPEPAELQGLTCRMQQVTAAHGLHLAGCTEPALAACGIPAGSCINASLLGQQPGPKMPGQRHAHGRPRDLRLHRPHGHRRLRRAGMRLRLRLLLREPQPPAVYGAAIWRLKSRLSLQSPPSWTTLAAEGRLRNVSRDFSRQAA